MSAPDRSFLSLSESRTVTSSAAPKMMESAAWSKHHCQQCAAHRADRRRHAEKESDAHVRNAIAQISGCGSRGGRDHRAQRRSHRVTNIDAKRQHQQRSNDDAATKANQRADNTGQKRANRHEDVKISSSIPTRILRGAPPAFQIISGGRTDSDCGFFTSSLHFVQNNLPRRHDRFRPRLREHRTSTSRRFRRSFWRSA